MATYAPYIDSETDPDAPLRSELGKRWDNNAVAIAEGASGAPRVQGVALDNVILAHGDMGGGTTIDITSGIDGVKNIYCSFIGVSGGAATYFRVTLSDDNGATWATATNVTTPIALDGPANFTMNTETGETVLSVWNGTGIVEYTGTATLPTGNVNAISIGTTLGSANGVVMALGGIA